MKTKFNDKKTGLIKGKSHKSGGIKATIDGTNQQIEYEGQEYVICADALKYKISLSFTNRTNKEVLDFIYNFFNCNVKRGVVNNGDFIICKLVVNDKKRHNYKGNIKEIINKMQKNKSCNTTYYGRGGKIKKSPLLLRLFFKDILK